MRRRYKAVLAVVVVAGLASAGYGFWRYRYPYGWSHCCDLILHMALVEYAESHDGVFPAGEATPEASLSLLHGSVPWVDAHLLHGKTVPISLVQEILDRGERLGPDTCGWHYVEGLRRTDNPRLALFWDKAGLGHNGERLSAGGHVVMFVDGFPKYIPASEWPDFLEEQKKLLAIRARAGELVVECRFPFTDKHIHVQLCFVEGSLYGRVWGDRGLSSLLAHLDREPSKGVVGLPILKSADVRRVKVIVDEEKERIQFVLGDRVIVFDGSEFTFE